MNFLRELIAIFKVPCCVALAVLCLVVGCPSFLVFRDRRHVDLLLQLLLVELLVVLELCELVVDLLYVLVCLVQEGVEEVHLSFHQSIRLLLLQMHLYSLTITE